MRINLWVVAVAAVGLCGCLEKGGKSSAHTPLFRFHWVGTAKLAGGTNAAALQKVLALPSTSEFRNEAFAKLARTPHEFWKKNLPAGAADQSMLLRPLLDDLWTNESVIELRGSPERPDLVVAVQVDDKRAEFWSTNLQQAASAWKLGAPTAFISGSMSIAGPRPSGTKGWSAGKKDLSIHYTRSGKWVLAAFSQGEKDPFEGLLKSDRPTPQLDQAIADLRVDWPRLKQLFPPLAKYPLPPTELKVSPRGETLRTEGKLVYSERLPLKLEPWKIPTNLVADPLVTFTCAQGIAPLLNHLKGFSRLQLKNPPNQFCSWGLGTVHAQTFLTVPMANATNIVKEIAPRLPEFIYANFTNAPGNFLWISNRAECVWIDIPVAVPHLHPERTPNGEFLFAGLFPLGPRSNTAPAELFAQVTGRTNLVYYDWELSQERLPQARHLFQLLDIVNRRWLVPKNATSQRWLNDITAHLGNSITEVTLTSPKELSLVRKSNLGFTGYELALLCRWIDSPGFPMRYDPPPLLTVRTNRPAPPKKQP